MSTATVNEPDELRRDEQGRLLAADGWPVSGLAHVKTIAAIADMSKSAIYQMISNGTLESKPFGRARRVPWSVVREKFLG